MSVASCPDTSLMAPAAAPALAPPCSCRSISRVNCGLRPPRGNTWTGCRLARVRIEATAASRLTSRRESPDDHGEHLDNGAHQKDDPRRNAGGGMTCAARHCPTRHEGAPRFLLRLTAGDH